MGIPTPYTQGLEKIPLAYHDSQKDKIQRLNQYVWNGKINWLDVEEWLTNFDGSSDENLSEQLQMLHLLGQFMYFGERELRELIRCLYWDKFRYEAIQEIRAASSDKKDIGNLGEEYELYLKNTRFLGVGNPSESGTHLLYYFRQQNSLSKNLFINAHEIFSYENEPVRFRDESIRRYVFLDDLCGSGSQASRYSQDLLETIKSIDDSVQVYYFVLFGMSDGLERVRNKTLFDEVRFVYELDESFKCYSNSSRYFESSPDFVDKDFSQRISANYGEKLCPGEELGFENSQLLLGLFHNTPNNTLPVMWHEGTQKHAWTPIFKRYDKKYGWGI